MNLIAQVPSHSFAGNAWKRWAAHTLGGKQFWTDHQWHSGWKLQSNVMLNRWRLLDESNLRLAYGSKEHCLKVLQRLKDQKKQPVSKGEHSATHIVLLIHGLLRTSGSMSEIRRRILQRNDERGSDPSTHYLPIPYSYASTRQSIAEHAFALREFIDSLPQEADIRFVCHSLGNIVVRRLLGDIDRANDARLLSRFRQFIMLGPPNQGSQFARTLSQLGLFEIITGDTGMKLGPSWESIRETLATPTFPFSIVAGDMTRASWSLANPFLPGPSDFVVSVDETTLEGCQEHCLVPVLHSFLPTDPSIADAIVKNLDGVSLLETLKLHFPSAHFRKSTQPDG
jgi:pimeloyl-ACP methyl ester carboxylesterase